MRMCTESEIRSTGRGAYWSIRGRHAALRGSPYRGYAFGLAFCLTANFIRFFIFGASDSVHLCAAEKRITLPAVTQAVRAMD
jgi:hypothetical protein